MQLKASFTLGEGRYGFSTGVPNLGMAIEESNDLVSDGNGPLVASPYERNRGETRGRIELLKSKEIVDALLQMSEEERESVLKPFGRP